MKQQHGKRAKFHSAFSVTTDNGRFTEAGNTEFYMKTGMQDADLHVLVEDDPTVQECRRPRNNVAVLSTRKNVGVVYLITLATYPTSLRITEQVLLFPSSTPPCLKLTTSVIPLSSKLTGE